MGKKLLENAGKLMLCAYIFLVQAELVGTINVNLGAV